MQLIINKSEFQKGAECLVSFLEENEGVFNLFINPKINNEIINLRSILFKIINCDDDIVFKKEDLNDKNTIIGSLIISKTRILSMLKDYLKINIDE